MPVVNKGKVLEIAAGAAFDVQGGHQTAAHAFGRWARAWGLPWAPTDEETAARRRSLLFMGGKRVNNGRGERLFDCAVSGVPISLKAGDSRDITLWKEGEKGIARLFIEAGAPIWCYRISAPKGAVVDFHYREGEEAHIPAPDLNNITMRRVNITPVILENLRSWDRTGEDGVMVRVRADDRNGGRNRYDRLNINFRLVPDRYWLDKEPVPFDAAAPLPDPFMVG